MGSVSIDVNANERKLEMMFPMNTREGVEVFLENINHIRQLTYYAGDYDALILLIDFEQALIKSRLSVKELLIIKKVFFEDMKRVDVAKEMDVTKQTIQTWIMRGTEKLAKYYEKVEGEKHEL